MAQTTCVLSMPQMIDLALNTPEVGVVNFRILHSLLHVIVQQIELSDCNVEFRGDTGEKMGNLLSTAKPSPSITLTEYVVTPGPNVGKVVQRKTKTKKKRPSLTEKDGRSKDELLKEKELRLIERRKDSKEDPITDPPPMASAPDLARKSSSFQTVVVVEPIEGGENAPQVSVALPKEVFAEVKKDIADMKQQIQDLVDLPNNMGLMDAVRAVGVEKSNPVLDMFQILTLTKRVDGTEQGISKLASMIEDLARETPGATTENVVQQTTEMKPGVIGTSPSLTDRFNSLDGRVATLEKTLGVDSNVATGDKPTLKGEEGQLPPEGGSGAKEDSSTLSDKLACLDAIAQAFTPEHIVEALKDLDELREKLLTKGGGESEIEMPADIRLHDLENKFNEASEQINSLDAMFNSQMNILHGQLGDLERELGVLVERLNSGLPAGDASGIGDQSIGELYNKILSLQADLEHVTETASKLLDEKEERQKHIDVMYEQIDLLKTIKADKEVLDDALADKADACAVNRKVSHDVFDATCNELTQGLEDALSKLTQQETLWQQALDDIQREIGTKLDKMELTPLRDFVNKKLKALQDKMKALAAIKKDQEAAGTKTKLLRNVNCISCDKDVVMRTQVDPSLMPKPVSLPPARSMGPYLAYELDALRKQQKCLPGSRNLHHFENAITGAKTPREQDHICNRYCGGSHTVTTPQQRVTRMGHFLSQWGPEPEPIFEGQIRGTDGQMYKSREMGDVVKDVPANANELTEEVSTSRPSIVVHSALVTDRQKSAKGEGDVPVEDTSRRKTSSEKKSSLEKKPSLEKRTSIEKKSSLEKKTSLEEKRPSLAEKKPSIEEKRTSLETKTTDKRTSSNTNQNRSSITEAESVPVKEAADTETAPETAPVEPAPEKVESVASVKNDPETPEPPPE